MYQYQHKNFTIQVFDDPTYKFGLTDNKFNYSKCHFGEGGQEYPISKHGIKVFRGDKEISNCIVIASGGATAIHRNSLLIDNEQLVICCCDTVFCLTFPDFELRWKVQADQATCFQLFQLKDDYLVHGELQITRLDREGKIKWQFGGADIFVSIEGEEEFKLTQDHIILTDFSKTKYKLDFEGNLIWDTHG